MLLLETIANAQWNQDSPCNKKVTIVANQAIECAAPTPFLINELHNYVLKCAV